MWKFGDFSAFSFQGAKLIVSGEGGILCTNNYKLYKVQKKYLIKVVILIKHSG